MQMCVKQVSISAASPVSLWRRCCAVPAQNTADLQLMWKQTGQVVSCPTGEKKQTQSLNSRSSHSFLSPLLSSGPGETCQCVSGVVGLSLCLVGRVMRLQGWVSFSKLAAGSLSSASWRLAAALSSQKHVCVLSQCAANMAEEAKKLAAYAAVDNHVQVQWTARCRC